MGDDKWNGVIVLLFSIFHLIINDMALGLGHVIIDISCDDYSYEYAECYIRLWAQFDR